MQAPKKGRSESKGERESEHWALVNDRGHAAAEIERQRLRRQAMAMSRGARFSHSGRRESSGLVTGSSRLSSPVKATSLVSPAAAAAARSSPDPTAAAAAAAEAAAAAAADPEPPALAALPSSHWLFLGATREGEGARRAALRRWLGGDVMELLPTGAPGLDEEKPAAGSAEERAQQLLVLLSRLALYKLYAIARVLDEGRAPLPLSLRSVWRALSEAIPMARREKGLPAAGCVRRAPMPHHVFVTTGALVAKLAAADAATQKLKLFTRESGRREPGGGMLTETAAAQVITNGAMGFIARLRSRAKKRRAAGGPRVRLAAVGGGGEDDEEAAAAAALAAVLSPSKRPTTELVKWLQMTEKAIGDGHAAARLSAKVRRDVPPWG